MTKNSDSAADFLADRARELWEAHGLRCAIVDGPLGGLNGYVQLPEGHPDRKQRKHVLSGREIEVGCDDIDVEVHGGLTYGVDDHGWVGFDTAHSGDHMELPTGRQISGRRWDLEDVKAETEYLAEQLAGRGPGSTPEEDS